MTQTEAERLLDQLNEQYGMQPYDPLLDLTVRQIAETLGLTEQAARNLMAKEARAGKVSVRWLIHAGRRIRVFRRIGGSA